MDWHYADGQEKRGPIPEEQMKSLLAGGAINVETLVWNATLPGWVPARETALAGTEADRTQRCLITGRLFPESQMIKTEHGWVSSEGKDLYYQCLREGAPLPVPDGMSNARADGKKIVVPVANPALPTRCVKTNQPATSPETKSRTLWWYPPLIAITILLSLLIFLILYLVLRKKIQLVIPLSKAGRGMVLKNIAITSALVLGGLAIMCAGFAYGVLAGVSGCVILIAGLIFGALRASTLRVVKLKNGEAWLSGACPEYVASLPPYVLK